MNKRTILILFAVIIASCVISCRKQNIPIKPEEPEKEVIEEQVFSFTHSNIKCYMPVLLTSDGSIMEGNVDWGDGNAKEAYSEGLHHVYNSEGAFIVSVYGKNPESVEFEDISGISSIDLSKFK